MKRSDIERHIPRRTLLQGAGATAAGVFLNPLFASAAGASPTRLLIVHRPCGTVPTEFFPQGGDVQTFMLPSITQSFEKLKGDMVILNGITCPRDTGWLGDQHSAGLIAMMSGKKFIPIPGTSAPGDANAKNIVASDKTVDQFLLEKSPALKGAPIPSIQSAAYRPSSSGLPSFRVMSYSGANGPLFPESRPDVQFAQIFGTTMPALSPEALARAQAQNKSVLDFVHKDLTRLHGQVPSSQLPKLDAHLEGIRQLENSLAAGGTTPGASCKKPEQLPLPTGPNIDDAQHQASAKNQLAIISSAFQCDLTRVATFSFAHGNSELHFSNVLTGITNGGGHHFISHDTGAGSLQARIDQFYCEMLSAFLLTMKAIPDGDGTLLDHTLVVFINECCIGNTHSIENMPVLMFGGKSLKLQTGRHFRFGGKFMNDVWAPVATAFGVPLTTFGDAAFNKGSITGLIG